jgi:hypothetical protein
MRVNESRPNVAVLIVSCAFLAGGIHCKSGGAATSLQSTQISDASSAAGGGGGSDAASAMGEAAGGGTGGGGVAVAATPDASGGSGAVGAGAGGGKAGGGAVGVGGTVGTAPAAKNYELTGSMPTLKAAFATTRGKLTYTKVVIHDQFLAESCAVGDYNNDGVPDVSSGRKWYEGTNDPNTAFKTSHVFRSGHGPLPAIGDGPEINTGVSDDWADYPLDVDGDGWTDIINVAQPDVNEVLYTSPKEGTVQPHGTASWYKNPGPQLPGDPMWISTPLHGDLRFEQHGLVDMNGDGFPEILGACKGCDAANTKGYFQSDRTHPESPWTFHSITVAYTFPFGGMGWVAGIGAGDVDGDGLPDLLERTGVWLQQPGAAWSQTACTGKGVPTGCGLIKEKTTLLPTGFYNGTTDSQGRVGPGLIFATDMDGDGLTDIVAADWAYGVGLFWYRQTDGLRFTKFQFMGDSQADSPADVSKWGAGFTEPFAIQVVDMDGDGAPDVITGKMRFAHPHGYGDPDSDGTPYVYVFKNVRGKFGPGGGPITLEPHLVDGDPTAAVGTPAGGMGVGRQIAIGHVNTDGIVDICVATKVGLAIFLGQ